jgi:hypothetical protein
MTPVAVVAILMQLMPASPALAAESPPSGPTEFKKEESQIPKSPTAPAPIPTSAPKDTFRCTRYFTWKGKTFECDSFVRPDAERLRNIVSDSPQAVNEINEYQATQARLHTMAYVASTGLIVTLLGLILHIHYGQTETIGTPGAPGSYTQQKYPLGNTITQIMTYGGLGIAGGSLVYTLGTNQANEARLGSAIQYYNSAHPDTPIELQFSTGFSL